MKRINLIIMAILLLLVVGLFLFIFNAKKINLPMLSGYRIDNLYKQADKLRAENKKDEAIKTYEGIIKEFPKSAQAKKALFRIGEIYEENNELLKAKDVYTSLISAYTDLDFIPAVQERLGNLNIKILFSPLKTAESQMYEVQEGDVLSKIAAQFHTTVDLIKKSNNLKGDNIRIGTDLKINTAKFSALVDKSQNILTLKSKEKVLKVYNVSTGANNCTPVGTFTIVSKLVNPVWYTAGAVVPSESPENILGTRWLGFSKQGYGIHGTTQPDNIGKQVTQGCVRMRNVDVEELYTILPLGTDVTIQD